MKTYKKIDFEDYLAEKHSEQYIGLDDDMPDDFNDWLCNLDPQELIDYGQEYAVLVSTDNREEESQEIMKETLTKSI